MPESSSSPLSYQTTMPEYPDTSYDAYSRYYYGDYYGWAKAGGYLPIGGLNGKDTYTNWSNRLVNEYNAQVSAYNTWLSSGAGKRASALSGDYNPSYFEGNNPSMSGVQAEPMTSPFADMAQGVSGILNFFQALQGFKLVNAQIQNQVADKAVKTATADKIALQNQYQSIQNKWLDRLLGRKYQYMGYQADYQAQQVANMFYPMYEGFTMSPYTGMPYWLERQNLSMPYQKAVSDLEFRWAATDLAKAQSDMSKWTAREKKWYMDNLAEIEKDILNGKLTYQNGEVNFQKTAQRIRKASAIAGISLGVANTLIKGISLFTPAGRVFGSLGSLTSPSSGLPVSYPENGGLDFSGFGSFSPYE